MCCKNHTGQYNFNVYVAFGVKAASIHWNSDISIVTTKKINTLTISFKISFNMSDFVTYISIDHSFVRHYGLIELIKDGTS